MANSPDDIEITGTKRLHWMYPNIYTGEVPLDRISIGLDHVRAANDLQVEYDGRRDGWVCRMDRTRPDPSGSSMEVVEEAVEVAFVPAWLEADEAGSFLVNRKTATDRIVRALLGLSPTHDLGTLFADDRSCALAQARDILKALAAT